MTVHAIITIARHKYGCFLCILPGQQQSWSLNHRHPQYKSLCTYRDGLFLTGNFKATYVQYKIIWILKVSHKKSSMSMTVIHISLNSILFSHSQEIIYTGSTSFPHKVCHVLSCSHFSKIIYL